MNWTQECERVFLKLKQLCDSTPHLVICRLLQALQITHGCMWFWTWTIPVPGARGQRESYCFMSVYLFIKARLNIPLTSWNFWHLNGLLVSSFPSTFIVIHLRYSQITIHFMYIITHARLDVTGQCWIASLANYIFTVCYKTGGANSDVDVLSQISWDQHITHIQFRVLVKSWSIESKALIVCVSCITNAVDESNIDNEYHGMASDYWTKAQRKDKIFSVIIDLY